MRFYNYDFPLPPDSDDELIEEVAKIYCDFDKDSLADFEKRLEETYSSLATPGWEEYFNISVPKSVTYPFIYEWVAVRFKKEEIEKMPENYKLKVFIENYNPKFKSNYLLDVNYKIEINDLSHNSKITFNKVNKLVLCSQHLPALCAYVIAVKYPAWHTYDLEVQKRILWVELPDFDYDLAIKLRDQYETNLAIETENDNAPF